MNTPIPYGGQAVVEGVMMRGRHQATVAVRRPDGTIAYRHEPLGRAQAIGLRRYSPLRGLFALWDMLGLGVRAMHFAAQVATGDDERALSAAEQRQVIVFALCFALGLLFVLPMLVASLVALLLPAGPLQLLVREGAEVALRLALLLGYIAALGRLPGTQRLFGYHGAEHKAVHAHEAGAPLTVEAVRRFPLIHPRCGTSFLLLVVLLSNLIFVLFAPLPFWWRLGSRIALVPLVVVLAYELVRLAATYYHRAWVRRLLAPLLALQRLTTREPDADQIAIAIAALVPVLRADGVPLVGAPDELYEVAEAGTRYAT
jgi:uncharacterized protein YqhQ